MKSLAYPEGARGHFIPWRVRRWGQQRDSQSLVVGRGAGRVRMKGEMGGPRHPCAQCSWPAACSPGAVNLFGVIADAFLPYIAVSCSLESRCALFFSGVPGRAALSLNTRVRWPAVTAQ